MAFEKISLELFIDGMESSALFHVIDDKTTYNILLGPKCIKTTQFPQHYTCFKYCRNGRVKAIIVNAKPFIVAEVHYTDAKFYLKDASMEDAQPSLDK